MADMAVLESAPRFEKNVTVLNVLGEHLWSAFRERAKSVRLIPGLIRGGLQKHAKACFWFSLLHHEPDLEFTIVAKMKQQRINLDALGSRICVIGPSSSGKSTLADLIGRRTGKKVIHLDHLAHEPFTNWKRRSDAAFVADHNQEIQGQDWIIEGNYSICMPQRFERATSVVWLDPSLVGCTWRYMMRCMKNDANRAGKLQGATKEFNLALLQYTWFQYPKNKIKYQEILAKFTGALVRINSMAELNQHCAHWGLK